ncbi:MAG: hypothetical protein HY445_02220 [Candidatus Niyogibacteria bacterium]|nr:hypothetical protein [Candidatus Niyogibacteria bacterium]
MSKFSIEGHTLSELSIHTLKASAHSSLVIGVETNEGWLILNRTEDPRQRILDIRSEYREKLLYVAESNISKKFAQVTLGEDTNRSKFIKQNGFVFLADSLGSRMAINERGNTKGVEKFSSGIDMVKEPRNTSFFSMASHSQVMLFEVDHYNPHVENKILHKWTMSDDHRPHRKFGIMGSLYVCPHSPIFDYITKERYIEVINEHTPDSYPRTTTDLAESVAAFLHAQEPQFFKQSFSTVLETLRPHLGLDRLDVDVFLETAVLDKRMGFRRFNGQGNEIEAMERARFGRWQDENETYATAEPFDETIHYK